MPVHTADRSGPPESRRAQAMQSLQKVARVVTSDPNVPSELLDQIDVFAQDLLKAYEKFRSTDFELKWSRFEAQQPKNLLKTVHELGLPKRFIDTVVYGKYSSYTSHCGYQYDNPNERRQHMLAGDLIQLTREEIVKTYTNVSPGLMKDVATALAKHGLVLGSQPARWIALEERLKF